MITRKPRNTTVRIERINGRIMVLMVAVQALIRDHFPDGHKQAMYDGARLAIDRYAAHPDRRRGALEMLEDLFLQSQLALPETGSDGPSSPENSSSSEL